MPSGCRAADRRLAAAARVARRAAADRLAAERRSAASPMPSRSWPAFSNCPASSCTRWPHPARAPGKTGRQGQVPPRPGLCAQHADHRAAAAAQPAGGCAAPGAAFLGGAQCWGRPQLSGFARRRWTCLVRTIGRATWTSWPELSRAQRAAASGPLVQPTDLPDRLHLALHAAAHAPREDEAIHLDEFLAEIEKELLERALAKARGNKSRAAELLGINRGRLLRRLAQLGPGRGARRENHRSAR